MPFHDFTKPSRSAFFRFVPQAGFRLRAILPQPLTAGTIGVRSTSGLGQLRRYRGSSGLSGPSSFLRLDTWEWSGGWAAPGLRTLQESGWRSTSVNSGMQTLHCIFLWVFLHKKRKKNAITSVLPGFRENLDKCVNVPSLHVPASVETSYCNAKAESSGWYWRKWL